MFFYILKLNMHDFLTKISEKTLISTVILFAILVSISETTAQTLIKSHDLNSIWFFTGIYFYGIVGFLLYYAYKEFPISQFNVIWSSLSIIVAIVLGYFMYSENINQNTLISLFFALLAIYFSNLNGK